MFNGAMLWLAEAPAPAAPSPAGSAPFEMFKTILFAGAIFAVLYFLILRPQKKKDQQRREMLSKVQRGQRVITVGGVYGEVESVKEDFVILLVDPERGTTLKFRRSAVNEILPENAGDEEKK